MPSGMGSEGIILLFGLKNVFLAHGWQGDGNTCGWSPTEPTAQSKPTLQVDDQPSKRPGGQELCI